MSEPILIAVVMDGGCLQSVISAGVPVKFVLVEYDDANGRETKPIPQPDGSTESGVVSSGEAEIDGPFVLACRKLASDPAANSAFTADDAYAHVQAEGECTAGAALPPASSCVRASWRSASAEKGGE